MVRFLLTFVTFISLAPISVEAKRAFTSIKDYGVKFTGNTFKLALSPVSKQDVLLSWFSNGNDMSPKISIRNSKHGREIYYYKPKEKALAAFNYGVSDFQSGNYYDALKKFKTALQIDPNFHKVYLFIGDTFFMKGHYKEAIKFFNILLKKNPIDYKANLYLADSYWKLGELTKAKKYLIRSLILNVRNGEAWGKLRGLGELMGFAVDNNRFIPLVVLDDKSKIVKVGDNIWKNYGLCKGVWKGDSEFFKKKTAIPNYRHTIAEEFECVVNLLEGINLEKKTNPYLKVPTGIKRAQHIASGGDLYGLVVMEIYLPQNPLMAALISEREMENLTRYIEKHILVKPHENNKIFGKDRKRILSSM